MFLSNFSIRRPVTMAAFILVLVLGGLNSFNKLGLNMLPQIDIPFITINTVYPGATPTEIEVDIAKKIEDAVSNVDGIKHLQSSCMANMCQTLIEFDLDIDVDVAATDIREKIDMIIDDLPPEAEAPKILKFDLQAKPIVTLLLTGDRNVDDLFDFADEYLADRLSVIKGVADVQVSGGEKVEVHVELDPAKLTASGLNGADIILALSENNIKMPSGTLKEGTREYSVTFDAEFNSLQEIELFEVMTRDGKRVRIMDIATVSMRSKEARTLAYYNGKPAVNIQVIKKGDANAVRVVDRISAVLEEIRGDGTLEGGMELIWFKDDGDFIKSNAHDALGSIMIGIALTSMILFMFLHEIRATIIIGLTMPTSIIITFLVMNFLGYTLNNMTLLALGTSIGVLVSNSIVVMESITKKIRTGEGAMEAAARGTGEVAVPVFASATTNLVVFIPVAMMPSILGRYFAPFAITMTVSTLASLFISYTLTPMLASKLLKKDMPKHWLPVRIYARIWNVVYGAIHRWYMTSIRWCARKPWAVVLAITVVMIALFMYVAPRVGFAFFPDNDKGEFSLTLEFPTDYNLNATKKQVLEISKRLRTMPEVRATSTIIGKVKGMIGQASEGVYLAEITVKTTAKNERDLGIDDILDMLREELKKDVNCIATLAVPSIAGGSESDVQLEISGNDLEILNDLAIKFTRQMKQSGMLVDVNNTVRPGKPEIRVIPKRRIVQDMNLSTRMLGSVLRGNLEGIEVGTYKRGDRSYDIRVELQEEEGQDRVREFTLMSQDGKPLNIETIANVKENAVPVQVTRAEKRRVVKIMANPATGVALGTALDELRRIIQPQLPAGYKMRFLGPGEVMAEAQRDFLGALITATVLIYLLIAAILESWVQPLIIMLTLPMGLVGMFTGLYLAGEPLSIMGFLGAMMLIGIVVNDAILIIEYVIQLCKNGIPPKDAMLEATKEKFRPVIMTSIAAILGIVPLAFGQGLGAEGRASTGITVIGGLVLATILTLYVIPLIYIQFVRGPKKSFE
jgi:HAE1 family hydrophobic/amphiphilic exporter-1